MEKAFVIYEKNQSKGIRLIKNVEKIRYHIVCPTIVPIILCIYKY